AFVIHFKFFGIPEVVVRLHEVLATTEGKVELTQSQGNRKGVIGEGLVQFLWCEAVFFLPFILEMLWDQRAELLEEHVSHALILANRGHPKLRPSRCLHAAIRGRPGERTNCASRL